MVAYRKQLALSILLFDHNTMQASVNRDERLGSAVYFGNHEKQILSPYPARSELT